MKPDKLTELAEELDEPRLIPLCCCECVHLHPGDDRRGREVWDCELSVWLPTKAQSCKKQQRVGEIR